MEITATADCVRCGLTLTVRSFECVQDGFSWVDYSWKPSDGNSILCQHGMMHQADQKAPERELRFNGPTQVYSVAGKFFRDHVSRGCVYGEIVSQSQRTVKVRMDEALWAELMSDAICWSDPNDFEPDVRNLCASARLTVDALHKQGRP